MGLFGFLKKKETSSISDDDMGLNDDPFKSDPLMDPDSGLNLPKSENQEDSRQNPYLQQNPQENNPYLQNQQQSRQDPFQKYKQQDSYQDYGTQQNQFQQQTNDQKDLQIIIAKLDALRAEVQALNHRLDNFERKQQKRAW